MTYAMLKLNRTFFSKDKIVYYEYDTVYYIKIKSNFKSLP